MIFTAVLNSLSRFLIVMSMVFFVTACVPAIQLKPSFLPENSPLGQGIAVGDIKDMRPPSNGGGNFSNLGKVRGGFGNPFTLKAAAGKELDTSLRVTARSALTNAGYSDPQESGSSSAYRLDMDVQQFWCDGYMGYKVSAVIVAKLVNNKTGLVVAESTINASQGFALTFGYGPMHGAFNRVMSETATELAAFMKTDEFRSGIVSR